MEEKRGNLAEASKEEWLYLFEVLYGLLTTYSNSHLQRRPQPHIPLSLTGTWECKERWRWESDSRVEQKDVARDPVAAMKDESESQSITKESGEAEEALETLELHRLIKEVCM